jgi:hypothetical protein
MWRCVWETGTSSHNNDNSMMLLLLLLELPYVYSIILRRKRSRDKTLIFLVLPKNPLFHRLVKAPFGMVGKTAISSISRVI